MKKIKALSLLMLLGSAQLDSAAATNPELAFVLSYQALDNFARTVSSDLDDNGATQLLNFMTVAISFDAQQKQQLAASQDGYLSKGTPIDPQNIAAQNKQLQARIGVLNANIKALQSSNKTMAVAHSQKIADRKKSRDAGQAQLQRNMKSLATQNAVQSLIAQNQLAFEQALETYIASFGQVYANQGSIVISSKYNKEMPITPKEYAQFVATLKNASSQFGSAVTINLNLNNAAPATIKDVIGYVGNMAPAGASYLSYAGYALAATALTAAAIATVAAVTNLKQDKDWYDTNNAYNNAMNLGNGTMNLGNNALASASMGLQETRDFLYTKLGYLDSIQAAGRSQRDSDELTSYQKQARYENAKAANAQERAAVLARGSKASADGHIGEVHKALNQQQQQQDNYPDSMQSDLSEAQQPADSSQVPSASSLLAPIALTPSQVPVPVADNASSQVAAPSQAPVAAVNPAGAPAAGSTDASQVAAPSQAPAVAPVAAASPVLVPVAPAAAGSAAASAKWGTFNR